MTHSYHNPDREVFFFFLLLCFCFSGSATSRSRREVRRVSRPGFAPSSPVVTFGGQNEDPVRTLPGRINRCLGLDLTARSDSPERVPFLNIELTGSASRRLGQHAKRPLSRNLSNVYPEGNSDAEYLTTTRSRRLSAIAPHTNQPHIISLSLRIAC